MKCKKCGKELSDDVVFCTECGTPVKNNKPIIPRETKQELKTDLNNNFNSLKEKILTFGTFSACSIISITLIVFTVVSRLFGNAVATVIFTACNIFIAYIDYSDKRKLNLKILLSCLIAFIVGIIMSVI